MTTLDELAPDAQVSLERILSDPQELDRRCRAALLDLGRTEGDEPTALYLRHHLEQLPDLVSVLAGSTATVTEAFVGAMRVRSIWADATAAAAFLHVDYTIDPERTDYVLSVVLDQEGLIQSVEMES